MTRSYGSRSVLVLTACLVICGGCYLLSLTLLWLDRDLPIRPGQPTLAENVIDATVFLSYAVVGALIVARKPGNQVGAVCLAVGVVSQLGGAADSWAAHAARFGSHAVWVRWLAAWYLPIWLWLVAVVLVSVFPDGAPTSRRWRRFLWVSGGVTALVAVARAVDPEPLPPEPRVANPTGVAALEPVSGVSGSALLLIGGFAVVAAVSLVLRYRQSSADRRAQIRWVAAALALVAVMLAAGIAVLGLTRPESRGVLERLVLAGTSVSFAAVPLAIGAAVLSRRLYTIDTLIDRALVGAVLLTVLTTIYVLVVTAAGRLLLGEVDEWGPSIVATAAIALAFDPLRRRTRRFVLHLMRGRRLPPYEALARLAGQVLAHDVDGGDRQGVAVMQRAVQHVADAVNADRVELWLRGDRTVPLAVSATGTMTSRGGQPLAESIVVGVQHGGEPLGELVIVPRPGHRIDAADQALLHDLAAQVGLLARNADLSAELQARLAELSEQAVLLRSSRRRIVEAQDAERRRLERDLHDGAQQRLLAVSTMLARLESRSVAAPALAPLVRDTSEELTLAIAELRELARGLHPNILAQGGLCAALGGLADRSSIPVTVDVSACLPPLVQPVEAALYYVAAEALTNAARHSGARHLTVELRGDGGWVTLRVEDDGRGGASPSAGTGLQGLSDRTAAAGGSLTIVSAPAAGTTIIARLPCG